jgi:hypothetical protein
MIKQYVYSYTAGQVFTLAFVAYANYQVLKWIFFAIKNVVTSDLLGAIIFRLSPSSVIKKREVRRRLEIHHARQQKEKEHQEALERHRKYNSQFFSLQLISEDRATLFKGFAIEWQEGNQKAGQTNKPWVVENREIAFLMFQEMAAYRWQFRKHGKWTPEMEKFWLKILPKQFVSKKVHMTELEKALIDFNDDIPTKASA